MPIISLPNKQWLAGELQYVDFIEISRVDRHLVWNDFTYRQNNKRDTRVSTKLQSYYL